MTGCGAKKLCPKSACCVGVKAGFVFIVILAALYLLVHFVGNQVFLNELKYSLSVWTVIALVIIVNLVSFLCFMVLFAAWRWIRRGLKTDQGDNFGEQGGI